MFEGLKKAFSNLKEAISTKEISEKDLEATLWDFELKLIESNVTADVARKISEEFRKELLGKKIGRFDKIEDVIEDLFKNKLQELLENIGSYDLFRKIEEKKEKPFVIVFLGINGTGKTTAIAKLAYLLKKKNYSLIIACGDTFRAGAIEQLELHSKKLGIEIVKHKYGASPTAVAYDAVQLATKKSIDVVLIDTAGRMQTDRDLLEEMKKLVRVIQPDAVFLVVDSLTGNDSYRQAEIFAKEVGYDGFILTKVDADDKGGVALSITYETKKPIVFISNGTEYEDFMIAKREWIVNKILGNGNN